MHTTAASRGATVERTGTRLPREELPLELRLDAGQRRADPRARAVRGILAAGPAALGARRRALGGTRGVLPGRIGGVLVLHRAALATDPLWKLSRAGAVARRRAVRARAGRGRVAAEPEGQAQGPDRLRARRCGAARHRAPAVGRRRGTSVRADRSLGRAHADGGAWRRGARGLVPGGPPAGALPALRPAGRARPRGRADRVPARRAAGAAAVPRHDRTAAAPAAGHR